MTLFGSNKGYSKKDINFFGEFTANARKQTQVLAVVVFVGIIAIGLCLAVLIYDIIRNSNVQKDIDALNAKLASEEYVGLELKAQSLQQEINDKNQYYYTLTQMRRIVDQTDCVSTEIADILGDSIPSSAYIKEYTLTGTSLSFNGLTFSYYDAANMCYILNQAEVFTGNVVPTVEQDTSLRGNVDGADNPMDIYYDFSVLGNLASDVVVSVGRYANTASGVIAISGISSETVEVGSTYQFTGINTYTAAGVNYSLVSVSINGSALSPEDFAIISSSDLLSGTANNDVQISLYYSASTAAETTEGGV